MINTFSSYYKKKYGQPVGKIALDRGVLCPNRAKGGCVFCAPRSFRPYYQLPGDTLCEQIDSGKRFLKRKKISSYFAYFQQETTTAASTADIVADIRKIIYDPFCVGTIISTRPDFLEDGLLDELDILAQDEERPREVILELGLQSSHDASLRVLNRNHSARDFLQAGERVRKRGALQLGAHLILGIPGEGDREMEQTVNFACGAGVQHLKIHHLQVITGTRLEEMYDSHPFTLFSLSEYMDVISRLLTHIPEDVVIHRLWSSSETAILRAPFWNLSNLEMWERVRRVLSETGRSQGQLVGNEDSSFGRLATPGR